MAGRDPQTGPGAPAGERQRLDKWLWFARVVKTRALAAKLVTAGHVRLNGVRAAGPDKPVRPGDVLTIALERQVRVLRVVAPGERRGPFEEAKRLYDDLTTPTDSPSADSSPDPGA
jgi:ribosome-associated heat shock protein Hsp15